ncbi:MAG TPA: hypothetical protein VL563_09085 [Gemmatimonadales bacterium]|nr:hypothetical protein [Gemmatimonadales bacterium]
MIAWRVVTCLLAAAPRLSAQGSFARLAGRIPPPALTAIDSILVAAHREGLPTEPLIEKAFEGGAKGVAPDRIVLAVSMSASQLRSARALLREAGESQPTDPAEVTAVAAALGRGLSPELVGELTAVLPGEPTGPALHAVADLVGHRFAEDSSVDLIVAAAQAGLRGLRFLDVAAAAVQDLQRGRSHAAALAHVRSLLPNVPPPPKPAPAAVSRARRVQPGPERP